MTDSTSVATVRLLCADEDTSNQLLSDDQYQQLLDLNSGNVKRAAADGLDIIATSEALVSKVIKTADLSTNGAQTADALRKHAQVLRAQADADEAGNGYFEIVNTIPDDCSPELSGW